MIFLHFAPNLSLKNSNIFVENIQINHIVLVEFAKLVILCIKLCEQFKKKQSISNFADEDRGGEQFLHYIQDAV